MNIDIIFKRIIISLVFLALTLVISHFVIEIIPKPDGPYVRYFKDQTIAEQGNYLNNQRHGYWQTYFESGRLKKQGQYVHGQSTRHWFYYFDREKNPISKIFLDHSDGKRGYIEFCKSGGISELEHYTHDYKRIGKYYEFYCTNNKHRTPDTDMEISTAKMPIIKLQVSYVEGNRDGDYISYHSDGKIRIRGYYNNDIKQGRWIEYDSQGRVSEKRVYEAGDKIGLWQTYKEGVLIKENEYITKQHVKHSVYYKNGQLKEQGQYQQGVQQGEWVFSHENGQLKERGQYQQGVRQGEWVFSHENGQLKERGQYQQGVRQGEWIFSHENGQLKERGQYQQGLRHGDWSFFDSQGRLTEQGSFSRDQKEGVWLTYHDGIKHSEENYQNNQLQGDYQEFHPNGNLLFYCTMLDGTCNGPYRTYFDNKQIYERGKFKHGYKNGKTILYYDNGQVQIRTNYYRGYFVDDFVMYYENGILKSKGRFASHIGYTYANNASGKTIDIVGEDHDGAWRYYYDNGQLRRKGSFHHNDRTGLWYYYDQNGLQTELRLYEDSIRYIRMKNETTPIPNVWPELDFKDDDYYF